VTRKLSIVFVRFSCAASLGSKDTVDDVSNTIRGDDVTRCDVVSIDHEGVSDIQTHR
jgi:hypothetical protein